MYDPKCKELSDYFLADVKDERVKLVKPGDEIQLAQDIQDSVEAWLDALEDVQDVE